MAGFVDWLNKRINSTTEAAEGLLGNLQRTLSGASITIPDDLDVLDSGLVFVDSLDELDYIWFHVREKEAGKVYDEYRTSALMHLFAIPLDARGDQGAVNKMRTALRGVCNAGVDIVYLVAGIFHPERLGIVQIYGVVGRGGTLDEAAERARTGAIALQAALAAAYPQIRLKRLSADIANWINAALLEMPYGILTVGHPDPRENARGGLSDIAPMLAHGKQETHQFTLQQNELVMRGMSQIEEDFLLQVLLTPFSMASAVRMLAGLAEYTSTWAAYQTGTRSFNFGASIPLMVSGAIARNIGTGYSQSEMVGESDGVSHEQSQSHTDGWAKTHSVGHSTTIGETQTHTEGVTTVESESVTDMQSWSETEGTSQSVGSSLEASVGGSAGVPGVASANASVSAGVSASAGQNQSATEGGSHSVSKGSSVAHSVSDSVSKSRAETHSVSDSETVSGSDSVGQSSGVSHVDSKSSGVALARSLGRGVSDGVSVGLAPFASMGEANQWQFDPAMLLTLILRKQQEILDTMTKEGGFYTDVYALTRTENGRRALMTLIPEAFHGLENVVMGIQTRSLSEAEEAYLRLHAKVMVPSTREIKIPEAMTGYADSTLLTMEQAAAYMTPGMFEEGMARTVQEAIPPFAFDPKMPGDAVMGRQYSTERAVLTESLLRLTPERHFHTAFVGDTGFGKSVAAERLAYETTSNWHYRTVVLDFSQGWRKAVNWPGMAGRVDIRQLYPNSRRPIRWNPLQISKRIDPARYRSLLVELFANAGRMGPRQLGFMRETLTKHYQNYGVLAADDDDGGWNSVWGLVRNDDEEEAINQTRRERSLPERRTRSLTLDQLESFERQALSVYRSRRADMAEWVGLLWTEFNKVTKARDQASRSSLQGVLLRLQTMAEGEMRRMYGPGYDTIAIEDLGLLGPTNDRWGVCVVEGGSEMDDYSKSALLSLLASILYLDAVVRRRESLAGMHFPPMQIVFEEANKVLTGVDVGSASDKESNGGRQTAQIFLDMWRDGRKFKCFLHLLAQTISELPDGILSSCNNGFFSQTKNDRDRQAVLAHLARNTKGFVNSEYDRFIARMPIGMAIAKLGYTDEITLTEPYLVRPLMLPALEPSDDEIHNYFRRYPLVG